MYSKCIFQISTGNETAFLRVRDEKKQLRILSLICCVKYQRKGIGDSELVEIPELNQCVGLDTGILATRFRC